MRTSRMKYTNNLLQNGPKEIHMIASAFPKKYTCKGALLSNGAYILIVVAEVQHSTWDCSAMLNGITGMRLVRFCHYTWLSY